jgi:hypothetical protein
VPELSVDIDAYIDHLIGTGTDELVVDRCVADCAGALPRGGLRMSEAFITATAIVPNLTRLTNKTADFRKPLGLRMRSS